MVETLEPGGIAAGFLKWPDLSVLLPAIAPRMIAMAGHNSNEKNSVLRFSNNPWVLRCSMNAKA
jgi:hypothetical protein